MVFYTFNGQESREQTEKHLVKRGEWDRQRISKQESNFGYHEHICIMCLCTNHKAIGDDKLCEFLNYDDLRTQNFPVCLYCLCFYSAEMSVLKHFKHLYCFESH